MTDPPTMTGDTTVDSAALLAHLRSNANAENAAGMARFGIRGADLIGISVTELRKLARTTLKDRRKDAGWRHDLSEGLWASGAHEARILAIFVEDPATLTEAQVDRWIADADSWDLVDQFCIALKNVPFAVETAKGWAGREEEFVKRGGFALMAVLARNKNDIPHDVFLDFLALVEREADDERNFVKKAVNWALRWIGERSSELHVPAVETAERIHDRDSSKAARWIASDALRELRSDKVAERLGIQGNGASC